MEIDSLMFIMVVGAVLAAFMAVFLYFVVIVFISLFSTFWEWVWGQDKEDGS